MVDLDKSVLKRNDLRCPGATARLNPNAALKILCFQSLSSEIDQFCSPAKQRPPRIASHFAAELFRFRKVSLQIQLIDDDRFSHRRGPENAELTQRSSAFPLRFLRLCGEIRL